MGTRRKVVIAVAGAAVFLTIAAILVVRFVRVDQFRPELESAASDALGLDVHVAGRMRFGVFPGIHLTAEDGRIRSKQGAPFATVKRANLYFDPLPLLFRQFRLRRIELKRPEITIVRDAAGKSSSTGLKRPGELLGVLDGLSVSISDGSLVYADSASGRVIAADGIDFSVRGPPAASADSAAPWKDASLQAKLSCAKIRMGPSSASDFSASVVAKHGVFDVKPIRMNVFGGTGAAILEADLSRAVPEVQIVCSVSKFRIEEFLAAMSAGKAGEGEMNFAARLSMRGASGADRLRSARGRFSLRGTNLTLVGTDLDRAISRYESSQHFDIVDVGAVFLVGPLGLAVSKGYDFGKLFLGSGEKTDIGTFVSDWDIEDGVAHATDVALTTPKNRIALQGGLDFVHGQFADVTVAVVDDEGCAKLRQTIRGPFQKPEVEKPHVISTLLGPVVKLYKTAKDILPLGPCDTFYSGSVKPPGEKGSKS